MQNWDRNTQFRSFFFMQQSGETHTWLTMHQTAQTHTDHQVIYVYHLRLEKKYYSLLLLLRIYVTHFV